MAGLPTPHPPVGGEAPLPPERSLPSYHEPTPETHGRMSREDEAELALTRTEGTRGTMMMVTVLFLLTIIALPIANLAARLRREAHGHARPGADLLALLPGKAKIQQAHGWRGWVGLLPTSVEIKAAEKNLEKESIVTQYMLPRVQTVLTGALGAGNEQVYPGVDGWLFYRPDVDYVIGPPFLDPARLKQRARDLGLQPDPLKAIVDFNEQLKARGIKLIVVPVRSKPGQEPDKLTRVSDPPLGQIPWENASFNEFFHELDKHRIEHLGLGSPFFVSPTYKRASPPFRRDDDEYRRYRAAMEVKEQLPVSYLETDTHWRPEMMARDAIHVADHLMKLAGKENESEKPLYRLAPIDVTWIGDIAGLLKLPKEQNLYRKQTVTIQQVQTEGGLWRPTRESEVLLLGDSFSNIYSLAAMGWGESAGFAEHLSYQLNRPLDCILQNSDGSFATRETLSREQARGHDRLAGKKVVIWEFAERELMFGNWKMLSMAVGEPKSAKFYNDPPAAGVVVTATVSAMTFIPRPGTVPYKDHVFSVHLEEIEGTGQPGNVQAIAYLWSMRENVWSAAAHWRPGDRVKLRLTPWPGAHPERESFNRSTFTDAELSLEETVWADVE